MSTFNYYNYKSFDPEKKKQRLTNDIVNPEDKKFLNRDIAGKPDIGATEETEKQNPVVGFLKNIFSKSTDTDNKIVENQSPQENNAPPKITPPQENNAPQENKLQTGGGTTSQDNNSELLLKKNRKLYERIQFLERQLYLKNENQ